MKKIFVALLLVLLFSCANKEEPVAITSTFDTVAITEALTDTIIHQDSTDEGSDGEYQLNYIVCVEEGTGYFNLRNTALKVAKALNVRFDTLERGYSPEKQRICLPGNHPDEIYAGDYYLRRYDDGFVSIEMRNAYADTSLLNDTHTSFFSDTTKMFVFAAMSADKKVADSVADILKKQFGGTKIIISKLYMGCMH